MPFIDEATLQKISDNARQVREYGNGGGGGGGAWRKAADVGEVAGTAGVLGYLNANMGPGGVVTFLGIPLNLWVSLGGYGAAWMGWAGRAGRDAEMVGHGALAGYTAQLGAAWGAANRSSTQGQGGIPEIVNGSAAAMGAGVHTGADGRTYVVSEVAAR